MKAQFRKVGNWQGVQMLVGSLKVEMQGASEESLRQFGKETEEIVRDHISKQDLAWKALSPKYMEQKKRRGWSDLTYVRTGSYFRYIKSYIRQGSVYIGISPGARTPEGNSLAKIAKVLEFGSVLKKIAARPLWRPSFNEAFKKFKSDNRPVKILLDRLRRRFKI